MKYLISFLFVLLFVINPMQAQLYRFEPSPQWVNQVKIPVTKKVSQYDIVSGFYQTLYDYQNNLAENTVFIREVNRVVSYSGITNASQLSVTYDTSYNELIIHHLIIWRDGKKIDRTQDLTLKILNNENNLQQGIYTGQVTAHNILNDIRKNDLVDFAYSIVGDNPIFEGNKYAFLPLETTNPIDLLSIRLIYPTDETYYYNCVDCDSINIIQNETDDYKEIKITKEDVKAIKLENGIPTWVIPFSYFTLSGFESWTDVNHWAEKVFALENEPNLDVVFEEIFDGEETTTEKIDKIIDFVQNEIRYMGIESGIGSFKPFAPEQVVKQRYGDCKDKSLLLVSLLKQIGITEAYPALVNMFWRHTVNDQLPSGQVFNHCIATFNYEDKTYWIDGTYTQQGGKFQDLAIRDYGKALIIGQPSDSLHNMNIDPDEMIGGVLVVDTLNIRSFTEPGTLTTYSRRHGYEADNRRAAMNYVTISQIVENMIKELSLVYPEVSQSKDIDIKDDEVNNLFEVFYTYTIDGFWTKTEKQENEGLSSKFFKFVPQTLLHYLNKSAAVERTFDYELQYPLDIEYRVIINLPKDILLVDDYDTFENDVFFYEEDFKQTARDAMEITYKLRFKKNHIEAKNYPDICAQINDIVEEPAVIIYFID